MKAKQEERKNPKASKAFRQNAGAVLEGKSKNSCWIFKFTWLAAQIQLKMEASPMEFELDPQCFGRPSQKNF